jgi:flagellar hook-length control protein FliK
MKMIQNSMMFQDAAPVVQAQLGRGTLSALRPGEGNGVFAELLQGKQAPQDNGAAEADPQAGEAQQSSNPRQGVLLRLQNSYGKPASAAGDTQDSQPAVSNGTNLAAAEQGVAQKNSGNPLQSLQWQNARLAANNPQIETPNPQPNATANLQTNVPQNGQPNTPQNVQPNDQANVQPTAQPNPQANVQLNAQSNAQQNVEASMQVNALPNAKPNLQPILSANLKPINMQQLRQSLLQDQPHALQSQPNQLNVLQNVQGQAPEESAEQSVAAAPVTAKGLDKQHTFASFRRATMAGEAPLAAGLSDTLQVKGAILASAADTGKETLPAAGGAKVSEPEKQDLSARNSLAADTQNTAPITDAQQGLAAVSLATAKDAGLVATPTDSTMSKAEQSETAIDMPVGRATAMPASAAIVADTSGPAVLAENSAPTRKDFGPARAAYNLKPEVAAMSETVSQEVPKVAATKALFGKGMAPKEAAATGTPSQEKFVTPSPEAPKINEVSAATGKIMGQGISPATARPAQETAAAFVKPAPHVLNPQSLNEANVLQTKTIPVAQQRVAEQVSVNNSEPGTAAAAPKGVAPLAADTRGLDETNVSLTMASPVFTVRAGEQIILSKKEPLLQSAALQEAAPLVEDLQGLNAGANLQAKVSPVFPGWETEPVMAVEKRPGMSAAAPLKEAVTLTANAPSLNADPNLQVKARQATSGRVAEQVVVAEKAVVAEQVVAEQVVAEKVVAEKVVAEKGLRLNSTVPAAAASLQASSQSPVFPGRETEQVVVEKGLGTDAALLQKTAPLANTPGLNEAQTTQAKASPVASGREAEQTVVSEKGPERDSALLQKAAPLAATSQTPTDAKTPQAAGGPVAPEQAPEPALFAKNGPVSNAAAPKDAAPLQAKTLNSDEVKNLQAKASPVASGREAEQAVTVAKGPRMDSAAQDQAVKAAPAITEGPQNADPKNSTVQPIASGAPEREQPALAASDVLAKAPAVAGSNGTSSPIMQAVNEAAEAASQPDRFAQVPTDTKGPSAAMGFHGTYAAVRNVTEQADSKQNAPVEEVGTKTAATAATAKFVPFQGSTGQNAFGDSDKKGHPEQKTQVVASSSAQPQGVGLPIEPAATEAPLPEAKPANLKSALHESILSQIKDGVVTLDSKGNGQMSIRLNPGELGELKIQVRMEDNKLHVEVHADNRMVKDLLMSNLDSLKDSLTSKNFTMEGFDVSTGGGFNSPLPEQKENPRQQAFRRSARAGAYPDQGEETKVNYLTGEVNNLLDVRF